MKDLWEQAFLIPLEEFFREVGAFLPHLLAMLVIVILGFAVAWLVETVTFRLLKVTRFDLVSKRVGFSEALSKGGVRELPSMLISRIFFWVVLLAFFMLGLGALQLEPVDSFVDEAFSYLPHLLVAATILVVGFILANFFSSAVLIAAVNAQVAQARFMARGVRWGGMLFAVAMALVQLGIATSRWGR